VSQLVARAIKDDGSRDDATSLRKRTWVTRTATGDSVGYCEVYLLDSEVSCSDDAVIAGQIINPAGLLQRRFINIIAHATRHDSFVHR